MSRTSSPYRRIADAIRAQIEAGELPEGTKVPSTRALARTWKVANATAAHALQTLTHEGLVTATPRSGTVVAGKAAGRRSELSQQRVIGAALVIADEEGLAALSIRGLSARLRVPVMSLYRHVRSKDQLIALMVDAALGETPLAEPLPNGWRAGLEYAVRAEWQTLRKHPWLARVIHISRPAPLPNVLAYVNGVMRALDGTRLTGAEKLQLHILLHGFTQGLAVNLEAEAQALADTGLSGHDYMRSQAAKYQALVGTGRYPYFAKMMRDVPDEFTPDIDELFERGLAAMLDGFDVVIAQRG